MDIEEGVNMNKLFRVILENGESIIVVHTSLEMAMSAACRAFKNGGIENPIILIAQRVFISNEEENAVMSILKNANHET